MRAIIISFVCFAGFFSFSCSGSLESIDAFELLTPVEDLPEPTLEHNVVVNLNNVADTGTSYKNWAELYINGQKIDMNQEQKGYKQDYHYHLILRPGVYEVKAKYVARIGDDSRTYTLSTSDEKFRVYPEQRTVLEITLDKKLNGELRSESGILVEKRKPLE